MKAPTGPKHLGGFPPFVAQNLKNIFVPFKGYAFSVLITKPVKLGAMG